jgi:hypothetical protein
MTRREKMKRLIFILALVWFLSISFSASAGEKIVFDGYWWNTLSLEMKIGFVQGFIDGSGSMVKGVTIVILRDLVNDFIKKGFISKKEGNLIMLRFLVWHPYDHTFGYYIDRIDGYYQATKDMRRAVREIMLDLMTPP